MKKCVYCGKELIGRQTKYCSKECKNKDFNENKRADYSKERGTVIKLYLIQLKGGKCEKCGYNKNISALNFHHINPELKSYEIDQRSCANRSLESLIKETNKCQLLCANCHSELHHPNNELTEEIIKELESLKHKYITGQSSGSLSGP